MSIAKIQAKYDALMQAHKEATRDDFIAHSRGELNADALEWRHSERLAELADYEVYGDDYERAERSEAHKEALKARRTRWHGFTYAAMRFFPYYQGLDLTKAQKAVLCALMAAGKGKKTFAVAHDWICAKAGVSRGSVKITLRRLEAEGLLGIRERRLKGKAMNLWNQYTVKCGQLLKWASSLFTIKGSKTESHPPRGDIPVSTGKLNLEGQELDEREVKSCRQKAVRYEESGAGLGLDSETFALVARGALEELGAPLPDKASENAIIEHIEGLKLSKQPDYKPYFWDKGVRKHGLRRTLLAFLDTQIVKQMRLSPIPDKRVWNERETVKCTNRYLSGILSRPALECRPELTLGAVLLAKQVYELPPALTRAVRARNQEKARAGSGGQRRLAA